MTVAYEAKQVITTPLFAIIHFISHALCHTDDGDIFLSLRGMMTCILFIEPNLDATYLH